MGEERKGRGMSRVSQGVEGEEKRGEKGERVRGEVGVVHQTTS